MTITTKYDIGDVIWIADQVFTYGHTCWFCHGNKTQGDGHPCTVCHGIGTLPQHSHWEPTPITITQITTITTEYPQHIPHYYKVLYIGRNRNEMPHAQHDCFPTEAEAQAECERRNNEATYA